MKTRYSFGGDEHIFVECDEAMSLDAFFKRPASAQGAAKDASSTAAAAAGDGDAVQPATGPIRADLLGNMWAQEWGNIYDVVAPAGAGDISSAQVTPAGQGPLHPALHG